MRCGWCWRCPASRRWRRLYPRAFDLLRYAGAAYLAWIGFALIRDAKQTLVRARWRRAPDVARGSGFAKRCWSRCRTRKRLALRCLLPLFIDQTTFDGAATYARIMAVVLALVFGFTACGWSPQRNSQSACLPATRRGRGMASRLGWRAWR